MIKNQMGNRVAIHGHRGSRGTHPENTMPAFAEGAAAGCDYLELDLHLTADDVPVVYHDPTLTGAICRDALGHPVASPIPVRSLRAAELRQFDCGTLKQNRFPEQKLSLAKIPTLEEVLVWRAEHAPKIGFNIEVKMDGPTADLIPDPDRFAELVVKLLRKFKTVNLDRYQSFEFETIVAARKLEPKLTTACLFETEVDFVARTLEVGAGTIGPFYGFVSAELVAAAHAKKLQVVPWTVNEESEWQQMLKLNVDGIITDYPRALLDKFGAKHAR